MNHYPYLIDDIDETQLDEHGEPLPLVRLSCADCGHTVTFPACDWAAMETHGMLRDDDEAGRFLCSDCYDREEVAR